ncbi:TonB-dependent receptor [Odoribacter splanchnicus]|nr:TonB-dependent receptor [Odoribacter splanchnicus]MDB9203727.1 TonB-dependent receptor [Odoribacter splanchnicus]
MISHNLTAIGNSAYDNTTSLNTSLVNSQRDAGIYLFGTSRHRQHYDHDGDHFSEIGKLKLTTLGFRSFYKPTSQTKLTLEYHNIREFRRGGNLFSLPPHETDITEQADHDINGGGVDFTFFSKDYAHKLNLYSSVQHTARQSYYGAGKDPKAYGKTNDLTAIAGIQYSYNFNRLLFMPAVLTTGSEYVYNKLADKMLGYHRSIDQKVDIYSFFLQNEWKTEQFSILPGGRLDKNSFIDHIIFSPRINLRYNPLKAISLRASYSAGFRAPQTYDEDLHVTAVGGEVSLIQSDPNLKTEKSGSYSVSADIYHSFGRVQTNLLIEAYYTKLKHIFVVSPIGYDEEGNKILERRNGSGAKVKGINLEGKIIPHRDVQIQLGISLQQNKYNRPQSWSDDPDTKKTREMLRSPNRYGYFTFFTSPFKKFGISASGTYTGSMYVPHMAGYIEKDKLEKSGDFFDTNIKLNYDFTISGNYILQLNCGIQNIFQSYQKDFDRGEFRDAGYIYGPGLPRSWFAGIKLSLN